MAIPFVLFLNNHDARKQHLIQKKKHISNEVDLSY